MRKIAALVIAAITIGACSDTDATGDSNPTSDAPTSASATTSPTATEEIDGMFDVGGHELYMNCRGSGSPTILYLHGSINQVSVVPHVNGKPIQSRLSDDYRMCVYDRRNLGNSDTVDAPQSPDDAMSDLHNLLAAAQVEPPYVLLGASFGGLLSYLYANRYPGEVVGMVLLDSPFPDELSLEHLIPAEERYRAFDEVDENASLERISHFKVFKAATEYIGEEPAIPVTYLASLQEPMNEFGIPEYDRVILDVQAAYVDRFAPGKLIRVDSPHFMEPAIPGEIEDALRDVIASAGY